MKNQLKIIFFVLLSCLIFVAVFFMLNALSAPAGMVLDKDWTASHGDITERISLPIRESISDTDLWVFETEFRKPDYQRPALLIMRPLFYALEVRVNGELIWQISRLDQPTANIWNRCMMIPLNTVLGDTNVLRITAAPLHVAGFSEPPFILEYDSAIRKTNAANLLLNDVLMLSIGGSLSLGLILLLLSISRKTGRDAAFYMGVSAVTAALYCLDYQYRLTGGSLVFFLIQKKLILVCGYVSAAGFLLAISRYAERKVRIIKPVIILTTATCIGILAAWDFISLYRVFDISNIILMLNLITGLWILLKMTPNRESFLIPMVLLALSIGQVLLSAIRNTSEPYTLQYILLVSTIFFSIHILLDFNNIFKENRKLAVGIHKDPLTGVFNRRYLKKIHLHLWDRIILTDIDNFKYYNDTYGHGKGDQLLLLFVRIVQENLRNNDLFIRLGGDEFLILLSDVDTEQADKILSRIEEQFQNEIDDKNVGFSYGIAMRENSIEETVSAADSLMYSMKRAKKAALRTV